jgi:hypothetical protein
MSGMMRKNRANIICDRRCSTTLSISVLPVNICKYNKKLFNVYHVYMDITIIWPSLIINWSRLFRVRFPYFHKAASREIYIRLILHDAH